MALWTCFWFTTEVRMLCTFGIARAMSYVHEPPWIFWQLDYYFLHCSCVYFLAFSMAGMEKVIVCVRYFIFQTKLLEYQHNRCTESNIKEGLCFSNTDSGLPSAEAGHCSSGQAEALYFFRTIFSYFLSRRWVATLVLGKKH